MRSFMLYICFTLTAIEARIYETKDAVVIEVDYRLPDAGAEHPSADSMTSATVYEDGGQQPCLTYDRRLGTCLSVRECYRYTRVHQLIGNLETWIIGTRGTCNYVEPDGKQVYGVCCHPVQRANRTLTWETFDDGDDSITVNSSDEANVTYSDASSRIVSGLTSYAGEYPFMAGIMKDNKVYCGGSLLDEVHVLTAAHCVSGLSSQGVAQLTVIFGTTTLRDSNRVTRRVHSVTRHKSFDGSKLYNDIALITLDSPMKFSSTISPVCLYDDEGVNHEGRDAVAIGWGNIRDGGPRAETLQKVTLQIKSQEDCRKNFGSKAPGGIVDHFICAYAPGRDACAGDSGGPLMMNRGNRQCQVGIVSWGIGCATDTYGVYTRISSFQNWINRNRIRF